MAEERICREPLLAPNVGFQGDQTRLDRAKIFAGNKTTVMGIADPMTFQIGLIDGSPDADGALEALLHESYVGGGFTDPDLADSMLRANAVRSRGMVLMAMDQSGTTVGTLTLVPPGSPARYLAAADEAELHLLCVRPDMRRRGIGRALIETALTRAAKLGAQGVVLWTQPAMGQAQRLYQQCGFHRDSGADFSRNNRQFLVYRRTLSAENERQTRIGHSR